MLRSTLRKDAVAEPLGGGLVEDAVSLEYAESVGIQHLGPLVAVVARRIAAGHDVRELHRHARLGQLFAEDGLLPGFLFKGDDVFRERFALCVVGHVEQSEAHLAQTCHACHEVSAAHDAVDQLVGNHLARLVMKGEGLQELALNGEILHELRGKLHEIPPHVGAR